MVATPVTPTAILGTSGDPHHHIDSPVKVDSIDGTFIPIVGWIWHPTGIERVEARGPKGKIPALMGIKRTDVADAFGGHPRALYSGFYIQVEKQAWSGHCEVWAELGDGRLLQFAEVTAALVDDVFAAAQERLLSVLSCPSCHGPLRDRQASCAECGRPVEWLSGVPSFLGRCASPLARFEPVSRHAALEDIASKYFDLDGGGLFLDAGAGWPRTSHPALLQLELEHFPSTNVVADGAELPFADATFDGVMSHAVIEHVRDPFSYARGLLRTLKPGGRFIVHSPFLVPEHAYPNHYFNTTLEGLKLLFPDTYIIEEGVADFQHPWVALEAMLNFYCQGFIDPEERARFEQMRVIDLVGDMAGNRPLASFQSLTKDTIRILATGVYLFGEV